MDWLLNVSVISVVEKHTGHRTKPSLLADCFIIIQVFIDVDIDFVID